MCHRDRIEIRRKLVKLKFEIILKHSTKFTCQEALCWASFLFKNKAVQAMVKQMFLNCILCLHFGKLRDSILQ